MLNTGERVLELLNANNMSQNELAHTIGCTKQTISLICTNKVSKSKSLYAIAKYFSVDYHWLTTGELQENKQSPAANPNILYLDEFHKIPFLTTKMLNQSMIRNGKLQLSPDYDNFEIIKDEAHKDLFALTSSNNALTFKFGPMSTLIFHTNLKPRDGDFVIAYLKNKDIFVYRDLKVIKNKLVLVPIDPDIYKEITLSSDDFIVAVLYEQRLKRQAT